MLVIIALLVLFNEYGYSIDDIRKLTNYRLQETYF